MISRRSLVAGLSAVLIASSLGGLAGCAKAPEKTAGGSAAGETQKLVIAASPSPHAKILNDFAKEKLAKKGIELVVKEYTDYIIPNKVTSSGEVDVDYFQHLNYLNNYSNENKTDLVAVAPIHYEPFGIYAGKSKDLSKISEGAQIALPNDPTNEGRALLLLQQAKLITLKDPNNYKATVNDIAENPKKIKFVEVEAAAVPRQLQDVDFAVINGNYAIEAGLHVSDALTIETSDGAAVKQYANYLVTTPKNKDDKCVKALVEVLTSKEFKDYLTKTFNKDVLPA